MNPLDSRKRLLIAESELNRAKALSDLAAVSSEVCLLCEQARTLGKIASSAAVVMAVLEVFRSGKSVTGAQKPSWLRTLRRSVGLVSTLWLALRPQRQDAGQK